MNSHRVIKAEACVSEGAEWLAKVEPRFAHAYALCQPLPLRRTTDGFDRLLHTIVGQQLSIASANSIWRRVEAAGMTNATAVGNATVDELRALGLSAQKAKYAQALAAANINYKALRTKPTEDVIEILVAVSGVGTWTAEIYAMFALGRADVFAPGDLALQESARMLFALPDRPKEREFRKMAEAWSPWRSVAARILWSYYRVIKQRDGTADLPRAKSRQGL
jgi:DNA-3-methyladenine glycosylase II